MTTEAAPRVENRFPPVADGDMNAAQRDLAGVYRSGWRKVLAKPDGSFGGPLDATMRSPGFARAFMAVSDYMRSESRLPPDLKEIVVLMVARERRCRFEWESHVPLAEKAGVSRQAVQALCDQRRPDDLSEVQAITYDAVAELLATERMSDGAFAKLKGAVGEELVIDIIGVAGYYSALSMILNVARVMKADPPPADMPVFPA